MFSHGSHIKFASWYFGYYLYGLYGHGKRFQIVCLILMCYS